MLSLLPHVKVVSDILSFNNVNENQQLIYVKKNKKIYLQNFDILFL